MSNNESESYVFTFGFGQTHPFTGESLADCYVTVSGDRETSRERMLTRFGRNWAFQYKNAQEAGADRFNLREIKWIDTVMKDDK